MLSIFEVELWKFEIFFRRFRENKSSEKNENV